MLGAHKVVGSVNTNFNRWPPHISVGNSIIISIRVVGLAAAPNGVNPHISVGNPIIISIPWKPVYFGWQLDNHLNSSSRIGRVHLGIPHISVGNSIIISIRVVGLAAAPNGAPCKPAYFGWQLDNHLNSSSRIGRRPQWCTLETRPQWCTL
jgi:hypothetical protein